MRPSASAKVQASGLQETPKSPAAPVWPGGAYTLRKEPIQTALEIQFRGVENLIRALDGMTWTRGRRRR